MAEDHQTWLNRKKIEILLKNLEKHGFQAAYAENGEKALELALKLSDNMNTVGVGGSDTVRRIGVVDALAKQGRTIHDHWKEGLSPEEDQQIRLNQGRSDIFFTSANAVSMTGEIVNVDGFGNRVAAMSFGPKKVVIIAGVNKMAPDLQRALDRIRETAAPMRAKSLNMDTPCAKTGICQDCNSPQRICRITTILHRAPIRLAVHVIMINQDLGF